MPPPSGPLKARADRAKAGAGTGTGTAAHHNNNNKSASTAAGSRGIAGCGQMARVAAGATCIAGLAAQYLHRCVLLPDYYEVLGLCRDEPAAAVSEAFYSLTKRRAAALEHVLMQEAFHVLSRPQLRARYDAEHYWTWPGRGQLTTLLASVMGGDSSDELRSRRWEAASAELVRQVQAELGVASAGQDALSSCPAASGRGAKGDGSDTTCSNTSGAEAGNPWHHFFQVLAASKTFRQDIWQRRPFVFGTSEAPLEGAQQLFKTACVHWSRLQSLLEENEDVDIVHFSEAVSEGKQKSWTESQNVHVNHVEAAMRRATIFINYAWALVPNSATVNEAIVEILGLPSNTNLYVTEPGLRFDSVPHSDQQDVFVLQCEGRKQWKVWSPPKLLPTWHQRGKDGDELNPDALGPPLLEVVLEPFQGLYLPLGFAHTTSTDHGSIGYDSGSGKGDRSLHLTVGVETISAGLTTAVFLKCALSVAALPAAAAAKSSLAEHFMALVERDIDFRRPLPLGFLAEPESDFATVLGLRATELLARLAAELAEEGSGGQLLAEQLTRKSLRPLLEALAKKFQEFIGDYLQRQKQLFRQVQLAGNSGQAKKWMEKHEASTDIISQKLEEWCRPGSLPEPVAGQ